MKRFLSFFNFCCFAIFSNASVGQTPLCTDLASYACSPGTVDDGTGQSLGDEDFRLKLRGIEDKTREFAKTKVTQLLSRSDSSWLRSSAINAFGLAGTPVCEDEASADCKRSLIEGLTSFAVQEQLRPIMPPSTDTSRYSFEDLRYIMGSDQFRTVQDEVKNHLWQVIAKDDFTQTIESKIVPQTKQLILEELKSMGLDDRTLQYMTSKIQALSYKGTDCSNIMGMDSLFIRNAIYNPTSNSIFYCSGFVLRNNSHFTAAMVIGHEIAHSIDPCGLSQGPGAKNILNYPQTSDQERLDNSYPIPNVVSCLRRSDSVDAKSEEERSKMKESPYDQGGVGRSTPVPELGQASQIQNADFCRNDQVNEAFCDWLSAKVLSKYIKSNFPDLTTNQILNGYSNVYRPFCSNEGGLSSHPHTKERINAIILADPSIRLHMTCMGPHPTKVFCNPNEKLQPESSSGEVILPLAPKPASTPGRTTQ